MQSNTTTTAASTRAPMEQIVNWMAYSGLLKTTAPQTKDEFVVRIYALCNLQTAVQDVLAELRRDLHQAHHPDTAPPTANAAMPEQHQPACTPEQQAARVELMRQVFEIIGKQAKTLGLYLPQRAWFSPAMLLLHTTVPASMDRNQWLGAAAQLDEIFTRLCKEVPEAAAAASSLGYETPQSGGSVASNS